MAASPSSSDSGRPSGSRDQDATLGGLASSLRTLLSEARGEIRRYVALDGLLLTIIVVLAVFWLGAAVDYLPVRAGSTETPQWVRAALLVVIAGGVLYALVWRLGRRLIVNIPDRNLAVLIERRYPELNNELVTAVELVEQPLPDVSQPTAYRAMLARVHASAASHVAGLSTARLLNWRPIYQLALGAGALLLFTAVVTMVSPAWMQLWTKRLLLLSSESWPRNARLRVDGVQVQLPAFTGQLAAQRVTLPFTDGKVRVPRGGSAVLLVSADTEARQVPELCTLFYRSDDGSRGRANLRRLGSVNSGWQQFLLDGPPLYGLTADLEFDVIGGDARLDDLHVELVDPAVVSDLQLDVAYPNYLTSASTARAARERLPYRTGVRIPEGSEVTLVGSAGSELSEVQYVVRSVGGRKGGQPTVNAAVAEEIEVLSVQPQGKEFTIPLGNLTESQVVEIRTLDKDGLTAEQIPRYVITVAEDLAPEVETKMVGIGSAVTPRAKIPLRGTITDDYGLSRVWTTLVVNEFPPLEIEGAVNAEGVLEAEIDLLQLAESRGITFPTDATLGMAVSAADHYDLGGIKHVGSGQPFQLAIVQEDKLLIILDRQELELRQRLEQIISELRQLREALVEQSGSAPSPAAGNAAVRARRALPLGLSMLPVSSMSGWVALTRPEAIETATAIQDGEPQGDAEQARRLALLRAQQSVLQADKSQQELVSVANRVADIRLQLINNRIDSVDRQARLQDRVYLPLQAALTNEMEDLRRKLSQLQTAAMSPAGGRTQALASAEANDKLLAALDSVIANMLDIESFNEIVNIVRAMLEDQERVLEETQKKQKELLRKQLELE